MLYGTLLPQYHFTIFLHFAIEIKNEKRIHIFGKAQRAAVWPPLLYAMTDKTETAKEY